MKKDSGPAMEEFPRWLGHKTRLKLRQGAPKHLRCGGTIPYAFMARSKTCDVVFFSKASLISRSLPSDYFIPPAVIISNPLYATFAGSRTLQPSCRRGSAQSRLNPLPKHRGRFHPSEELSPPLASETRKSGMRTF
jgi:hypothetical protein